MSYPKERVSNRRIKLWRLYRNKIWERFRNYRGITAVLLFLRRLINNTDKIKDDRAEPLIEKEWDNLVIIDAARHDIYQEEINSEAESRITQESNSGGFIEKNFSEGDWSDTVVITANPFYNKEHFKKRTGRELDDVFHTVFHTWKTEWNEKEGTVMPEDMIKNIKTAEKLFPEKRKIAHFMQPHYPFINSDLKTIGYGDAFRENKDYKEGNIWQEAESGRANHKKVLEAYKKNYRVIKPHLKELNGVLSGDCYITADHGNLLGESGIYGHPGKSRDKPLRKVPWDNLENLS